jgi:putative ATPase
MQRFAWPIIFLDADNYAHDAPGGYVRGERYLPDEMPDRRYYRPVARGLELRIAEALARRRGEDGK